MPRSYEEEIAAFVRAKGVTRCPTACAAPTHASGDAADRATLRERAAKMEARREERARSALEFFTPEGRYADAIDVGGERRLVREADGIHLNEAGSELAADEVMRALGEDFEGVGAR